MATDQQPRAGLGPKPLDLHYGHPRMALSDRAKIFIPFDPLKGFREALAEEERKALARHDH